MVSRERDSYYEELVTQVQQSSLAPFHPTAVAVPTPAPGYTAPAVQQQQESMVIGGAMAAQQP
eukprot:3774318-Amphidinium_carterae.1